jgi:hypothetical protein
MTDPDPKKRPSADEIIKSPEVQNWSKLVEEIQWETRLLQDIHAFYVKLVLKRPIYDKNHLAS